MSDPCSSVPVAAPGSLYVVSAPSGGGKRAVLARVMAVDPGIEYSVSATTRPPRADEVDGRDYYFLSREEFCRRIEDGRFAEWAEVHDNLYGTLREELDRKLDTGKDLVLELDVQGMRNVRALYPDTVTVFIMPPSFEELERRLRGRGTNSEADIALRLRNAQDEIAACYAFDYIVLNDDLDKAVEDMEAIVRAQRCRTAKFASRARHRNP